MPEPTKMDTVEALRTADEAARALARDELGPNPAVHRLVSALDQLAGEVRRRANVPGPGFTGTYSIVKTPDEYLADALEVKAAVVDELLGTAVTGPVQELLRDRVRRLMDTADANAAEANELRAAVQNTVEETNKLLDQVAALTNPEYFIVHDGDGHVLLADGEFDGPVTKRHTGTWVSEHRKGPPRIFHKTGQRSTFTSMDTGVRHVAIGVVPYRDADYTEEQPQR